jgi:hypothetical protein|tara:strand:- start:180 stop:995 length:816 start_codon:yes stop_codon:yes gene_type:complete
MDEVIEPSTNEDSQETEVTQEATGLLDNATPEEAASTDVKEVEIEHRPEEDLIASGEKETEGEKPDWLPENFWKGDNAEADYEAMAKSWTDLRKQISQGKHKAPKDGVYDAAAFGETPDDDPVKNHVLTWAKDNGISQAGLDDLVGQVVEMGAMGEQTYKADLAQERKELGPNADARINGMVKWASGLVQKGIWGNDDFEEFKVMGGTAKGIAALEKIRSSYEGRIPTDTIPVDGAPSKDELYAMVGDEKYQTDPVYRAKVEKAFAQNFPT